jgi:hypothetical protein
VASWLVGAGSERQVIVVVCGSGIGDVLIELWFLFVCLGTLCEERCERWVSIRGEGEALPPLWRGGVVFG